MENIDYKKLSNAIAIGIVKSLFIFFGIYAVLSLALLAVMRITGPNNGCIHVWGVVDCPNPEGYNISLFGGTPQGLKK